MGLLDTIAGMAGGAQNGGAQGGQSGGLGGLGGLLGGGGGSQAGVLGAVVSMLQSQPGGVMGVVEQFQRAGLGGLAQSWINPGQNQPVSPDQVTSALGQGPINDVAGRLGIEPGEAAGHLSQYLPQIIDHLTPHGQAPADGGLGGLGGLLSQLTGGQR